MKRVRLVCILVVGVVSWGCASLKTAFGGGVDLESMGLSAESPSNVSVYLRARANDQPLPNLDESAFRIYEDGRLLDATEARPALLDRTLVADYRALLLLDLSGALNEGAERDALARASGTLVGRIVESEPITVFAFTGEAQPTLMAEYSSQQPGSASDLESKVKAFAVRDSSRDLGSALVEGIKELDARLGQNQKPFRIGTLVVFSKGPDLAHRISEQALWDAFERSRHHVVTIGIGEAKELGRWGRAGFFTAKPGEDLGLVFERAAMRVVDIQRSHYLLSYCSPARAGRRSVRVEVVTTGQDGELKKGHLQQDFDASAFGPGCDPKQAPRFLGGVIPAAPPASPTAPGNEPAPPVAPVGPEPATPGAPAGPAPAGPAPGAPAGPAPAPTPTPEGPSSAPAPPP
jgi:hypothetical protein